MAESDIRQRAIRCSDAVWSAIKARAGASDISVNEYVIARLTGSDITQPADGDITRLTAERDDWKATAETAQNTGYLNQRVSDLTAERDAALKLAKAAEENVARLEADAVRIPPVPSVDTETGIDALDGLEERMTERAAAVGMSVDAWLRGLVQITLDRPIPGSKTSSKATPQLPSTKHLERDPSSRFASLKVAPADAPNVKWQMYAEPGPPAWMTAPTTKPGMTRDQALGAGMEAARIVMGGKAA